jgi:hypothetical protein
MEDVIEEKRFLGAGRRSNHDFIRTFPRSANALTNILLQNR